MNTDSPALVTIILYLHQVSPYMKLKSFHSFQRALHIIIVSVENFTYTVGGRVWMGDMEGFIFQQCEQLQMEPTTTRGL